MQRARAEARAGLLLALLVAAVSAEERPPADLWVFLRDKPGERGGRISWGAAGAGAADAELDLPVDPRYIESVRAAGIALRARSRWFNALSVHATSEEWRWLEAQPFVLRVRPVRKWRRRPVEAPAPGPRPKPAQGQYGPSFEQLARIAVPPLHELGFKGQGVRIGVLDTGFKTGHKAFAHLRVVARRDFINGDAVVGDQAGQPLTGDETLSNQNEHGSQVLSLLAASDPGRLIGAAPEAEYILAKTEDLERELPIEEDRWVQALEWVDSLGAEVVNTSLGYNTFDDGSGYAYEDLDGATALTTRAAEMAVRRGIVVVVAAGNEGDKPWIYVTVPADAPGALAVGALTSRGEIAAFSSRGPTSDGRIKPDVVAPGEAVVVADVRSGDYRRIAGTSFSAPLVAGACALLRQIHPDWTPSQVAEALRRTATDLGIAGPDTAYGWGRADALAASGLQEEISSAALVQPPFPNPVRGSSAVYFPLPLRGAEEGRLRIFDVGGTLVAEVSSRESYSFRRGALRWEIPPRIDNGLYFYHLQTSTLERRGKIALVRRKRR